MSPRHPIKARLRELIRSSRFLYPIAMILLRRRSLFNDIRRKIYGENNRVVYSNTAVFNNCRIDVIGSNNEIVIGEYCMFHNVTFLIRGNHNRIRLSNSVRFNLGGSLHIEDDCCLIDVGESTTFEDTHIAATEPGSSIIIGNDCMFAYDVEVRTGDSHSIIDSKTNRRLNNARDVRIGDHVWVAAHCSILKGVTVRKNCVLATRSVLTRSFVQDGLILGGIPAKILRENITWERERIYEGCR